jgi:ribose/xylose/arabinose/galactoside ABC-type transport system permease subunit
MSARGTDGIEADPGPGEREEPSAEASIATGKGSARITYSGFLDLIGRNVAPAIFLALLILASLFVKNFADVDNAAVILKQSAIPAIAVIGMTMVLMTGGIDLSLGYVVGLASIASGILANTYLWPTPAVLAAILVLGLGLGLCNGLITQFMRVPAFIATLGTGYVFYGVAQIVSQGSNIDRLPKSFLAIGRTRMFGLPSAVFLALGVAALFHVLISRTIFGRQLKAFGLGARAAALSGVPCARINVTVYALCATLAALSGLLFTIRVNAAQPNMGGGAFTFEVVTGAIVGGASLFGGVGSVVNSILGVLSIKIIENCINLMGVSYHLYLAVQGLIILVAIVFGNLSNRRM